MFCTKCGSKQAEGVSFCSNCGNPVGAQVQSATVQPVATAPVYVAPVVTQPATQGGAGLAWAIVSFVVTGYGFFSGLNDLGGVSNGTYGYIYPTEVGLLAAISVVGIILGSISMRLKHPAGRWAVILLSRLCSSCSAAPGIWCHK